MKRHLVLAVLLLCLLFVTLAAGVSGGIVLDRLVLAPLSPAGAIPSGALPQFRLMGEAWNIIQRVYVDRSALQAQKLAYGAISGMVEALGDTGHSRFLSPDVLQDEQRLISGQFEGIGVEVQTKGRYTIVVAPLDGTPAEQAGLRPGDVILKVDGQDLTGLPLTQVRMRILGAAGTKVTLTLLNPTTGSTREVTLTRAHITIHSVTWQMVPGTTVAHVRIAEFSHGAANDLRQALADSTAQGATGVILDLRSNPGGVLDEAVGATSQFLARGNVFLVRDVQGKVTPVPVQPGGDSPDVPLVVLINGGTASAGEIVAGALQDAGRGKLVGETTFGTGTVLKNFALSDGSSLLLATQEWLTPNGRQIWHQGIVPDVAVELPADAVPLLPRGEEGMTAEQVRSSSDTQVLKALELLQAQ